MQTVTEVRGWVAGLWRLILQECPLLSQKPMKVVLTCLINF